MTAQELISEFEILFEDLATAGSKGLDDYEKSICYTFAQEQMIRAFAQGGDLEPISKLVKVHFQTLGPSLIYKTGRSVPDSLEHFYEIGYFIQNAVKDIPGTIVSQGRIDSMLTMPYQYPPKDLVYVVVGESAYEVFLPLNYDLVLPATFATRYVEYPTPIILEELTGGETINSLTQVTLPIIEESYHRELVNAAVQYAVTIYIGQQEKEVSNGSRGD